MADCLSLDWRQNGAGELESWLVWYSACWAGVRTIVWAPRTHVKSHKLGRVATVSVVSASRRQNPFKAG